jgi:stromal membrane-associated protein
MGTHISRVKSVDLDAWTDEQLQSVLKWGNSRANKSGTTFLGENLKNIGLPLDRYWEAKLAAGHVPSEAYVRC